MGSDSNLGIQADQARNILLGQLISAIQGISFPSGGGGAQYNGVASATSDYTILSADYSVFVDASGGPLSITLPDPTLSSSKGRIINVKKTDSSSNAVTVTDGTTTVATISTPGNSYQMQCDGAQWQII